MSNKEIDVLNDVTKMLIDSRKGYAKAAEVTEDNFTFNAEFKRREENRALLVKELQNHTRALGGDPERDGGMLATLHRATLDFTTLFKNDVEAALDAIDDGEEKLAEYIKDKLSDNTLTPQSTALLRKAHAAATAGERFAEKYEKAA